MTCHKDKSPGLYKQWFTSKHGAAGVTCIECHGAVEAADRLRTHTFYMGFCLNCHKQLEASLECTACHQ